LPALLVALLTSSLAAQAPSQPPGIQPAAANEHPLTPALRWARDGMSSMEKIQDYSATVVKRERIGGKLKDMEYMFVKIRHKPFSVYMYFLGPANLKGQECMYIQGANNGNMWAHGVGIKKTMFGTVSLKPDGPVAMNDQRYPLTEIGVQNLTKRLIEVAEQDVKYDECDVKMVKGGKINDRPCTCIQVVHPVPRRNFLFHIARIFVDEELNVPVRYESYDWPKEAGATPELMEEYTYLNLKVNNGFKDEDFDINNPKYGFK
jgi:outer membrane lipoprotein-sorting protein